MYYDDWFFVLSGYKATTFVFLWKYCSYYEHRARLVTCIRRGQALYGCSCRAFGWLVEGWGLSHAVQDSLVSPAQLIRQKSSFLRGQARASAASMWTGHVSETADARMQWTKRNLRTAYDNQTPVMCMRSAWLISEANQTRPQWMHTTIFDSEILTDVRTC